MAPSKTFSVSSNGSSVLYFTGHELYDALRVVPDTASSGSTSTDITVKVDSNNDLQEVKSDGFGSMDATVDTFTGVDFTAQNNNGTTKMARTVAVEIDETSGGGSADGTIELHSKDDPAQNADSFAAR
jgi:hypothetical protein